MYIELCEVLQVYEPGIQYDAHNLLQLLAKIYPSINDDCMFKIDKLQSTVYNDCGHTTNNVFLLTGCYA